MGKLYTEQQMDQVASARDEFKRRTKTAEEALSLAQENTRVLRLQVDDLADRLAVVRPVAEDVEQVAQTLSDAIGHLIFSGYVIDRFREESSYYALFRPILKVLSELAEALGQDAPNGVDSDKVRHAQVNQTAILLAAAATTLALRAGYILDSSKPSGLRLLKKREKTPEERCADGECNHAGSDQAILEEEAIAGDKDEGNEAKKGEPDGA